MVKSFLLRQGFGWQATFSKVRRAKMGEGISARRFASVSKCSSDVVLARISHKPSTAIADSTPSQGFVL